MGNQTLVNKNISSEKQSLEVASQWQLIWWRFRKHKLAMVGVVVIIVFYIIAFFAPFIAPYGPHERTGQVFAPPLWASFITEDGFQLRPVVFGFEKELDMETFQRTYYEDRSQIYPIEFFTRGQSYKLFGIIETDLHLFGVEEGGFIFLMGTDKIGRDVFSRVIYGARISLSIGLIGVILSLIFGLIFGGISGYFGGRIDLIIQRIIEILRSFPTIPLWMTLAAAIPKEWSPINVYFAITVILSLVGWTGLARVVRGRFLSIRDEDFVYAARMAGASNWRIIRKHLIPSFYSHIIASITLAIPQMIIAETSLSFLGLGLRAPVISLGVLLQGGQNINAIVLAPWLLMPALFVIVTVLSFNFVGDGLRDAADPYSHNS